VDHGDATFGQDSLRGSDELPRTACWIGQGWLWNANFPWPARSSKRIWAWSSATTRWQWRYLRWIRCRIW
jgi:hypothetical protein